MRGSGRTKRTSSEPDGHDPAGGEPGDDEGVGVELLAGEERPEDERAERGAEERTEEDERDPARPALGREHVGGGRAREQHRSLRDADEREADDDERGGLDLAAERRDGAADDARDAAAREHRDPPDAVHQPPGGQRGERAGGEEDRRPEPEDPLDARDEDERDGRDGDRAAAPCRTGTSGSLRAGRCSGGSGSRPRSSLSQRCRQPGTKRCRTAVRRMADVRPAEARVRDPADRDHATTAVRELGEERRTRLDLLRASAAGSSIAVPGWVGTTFQRRTSLSIPSSASTAWTIVAVASAGPVPVSWRSEVSGMPETRVAAIAGRLGHEQERCAAPRGQVGGEALARGAESRRTG